MSLNPDESITTLFLAQADSDYYDYDRPAHDEEDYYRTEERADSGWDREEEEGESQVDTAVLILILGFAVFLIVIFLSSLRPDVSQFSGGKAEKSAGSSKKSLFERARENEKEAVIAMLRQFIPESEEVYFAEYLGTAGLFGFGMHSFGYLTESRVASINVSRTGEVIYQDGLLTKLTGSAVYQPSLVLLVSLVVLNTAAAALLFLYLAPAGTLIALGISVLSLCIAPILARVIYRKKRTGAVFWIEGATLPVMLNMNRGMIGRASKLMSLMGQTKQNIDAQQ